MKSSTRKLATARSLVVGEMLRSPPSLFSNIDSVNDPTTRVLCTTFTPRDTTVSHGRSGDYETVCQSRGKVATKSHGASKSPHQHPSTSRLPKTKKTWGLQECYITAQLHGSRSLLHSGTYCPSQCRPAHIHNG